MQAGLRRRLPYSCGVTGLTSPSCADPVAGPSCSVTGSSPLDSNSRLVAVIFTRTRSRCGRPSISRIAALREIVARTETYKRLVPGVPAATQGSYD